MLCGIELGMSGASLGRFVPFKASNSDGLFSGDRFTAVLEFTADQAPCWLPLLGWISGSMVFGRASGRLCVGDKPGLCCSAGRQPDRAEGGGRASVGLNSGPGGG